MMHLTDITFKMGTNMYALPCLAALHRLWETCQVCLMQQLSVSSFVLLLSTLALASRKPPPPRYEADFLATSRP